MQAKDTNSTELRRALAQFATGITIVTTCAADGTPVGLTANSFASVSLNPPLVLWSLAAKSASFEWFRRCERYAIHVLAFEQLELAKRFATRGADKFGATPWQRSASGLPRLDGCVAWMECANRNQHEEGDHLILVGQIENFEIQAGAPLIFHNSRYLTHLGEAPLPKVLRSPWD